MIPAEKAKGNKPIAIPLGKEAIAVLMRRQAATKGKPWVFPGRGKKGHLAEPKSAWKRVCTAAGLQSVRLHDLRHTTASWMVAGGASLYTVGKALGHASTQSTQRYAHLDLSSIRNALGGATAAMMTAAKPPEPDKPKSKRVRKAKGDKSNG
jgi:integrase